MEIDQPENNNLKSEEEKCETPGPAETDRKSVCALYEMIDNPDSCLVTNQVDGNTAKMVLICLNGEQKLISFHIPREDCTVQDLLNEAKVPSRGFITFLVKDARMESNYVVTHVSNVDSSFSKETMKLSDIERNKEENELLSLEWEGTEPCGITRKTVNQSEVEPRFFQVSENSENSSIEKDTSIAVAELAETHDIEAETILETESVVTNNITRCSDGEGVSCENGNMEYECSSIQGPQTFLISKIVMIGSYSYTLQEKIIISQSGVRLRAPHLKDATNLVLLELKLEDILKVLIHFGEATPVLFFWVGSRASDRIRECLGMHDPEGPYYRPDSEDNKQRRITLLVNEITKESKLVLKTLFSPNNSLSELSSKEAADLLWSISAKDIRPEIKSLIKRTESTMQVVRSTVNKVAKMFGKEAPSSSQVSERTRSKFGNTTNDEAKGLGREDQSSTKVLGENESRVDNTEYKKTKLISEGSKSIDNTDDMESKLVSKTSKRLLKRSRASTSTSTSNNPTNEAIPTLLVYPPPPARGGITITAKDLACLEEGRFLNDVIIDFYLKYLHLQLLSEEDRSRTHIFSIHFYTRLISQQSSSTNTNEPISQALKRHASVQNWTKTVNIFEKDFIVVPINEYSHWFLAIICFPGLVGKQYANPTPAEASNIRKPRKAKEMRLRQVTIQDKREIRKCPCILIFDSLGGAPSKTQSVVDTLRGYLRCEHLAKFGKEIIFSEETIKGVWPKVLQQDNFSDCGLYVLQYVESFFSNPITDYYTLPITTLENWFSDMVVARKRRRLSKLIKKLMEC